MTSEERVNAEEPVNRVAIVSGNYRYLLWMLLAFLVVLVDQATKWAIVKWIPYLTSVELNSFMNLTHQRNFGAAWSFLADAGGWQRWFFIVLATGVSAWIAIWLWKIRESRYVALALGLSLLLGGAVGNLVDRVLLGYVTDFIQVYVRFIPLPALNPFPSFNVADSAISAGVALLIVDAFFFSGRESPAPDEAPETASGDVKETPSDDEAPETENS